MIVVGVGWGLNARGRIDVGTSAAQYNYNGSGERVVKEIASSGTVPPGTTGARRLVYGRRSNKSDCASTSSVSRKLLKPTPTRR